MNKKINRLLKKLNDSKMDTGKIEADLQEEFNKVFDSIPELAKAVTELESSTDYFADSDGIYSWVRFYVPKKLKDVKEYLREYFNESHNVTLDIMNDSLAMYHGDDNIMIRDDTRNDNGVWHCHEVIIQESEYKDDDGIDIAKRNELIEKYMEKTGYFPGVFRIDYHGNVFPVNTREKS